MGGELLKCGGLGWRVGVAGRGWCEQDRQIQVDGQQPCWALMAQCGGNSRAEVTALSEGTVNLSNPRAIFAGSRP
jgi:hypothetical protein